MGLFKSGAPFCGAISFLLTSPILNPAIVTLMLAFFGIKATVIYMAFTFAFAVVMGLILDAAGFEKEIKNVSVRGGHQDAVSWETMQGTFWQKQLQAFKISIKDAFGLFKGVVLYLLLGLALERLSMNLSPPTCWRISPERATCGPCRWRLLWASPCISARKR